jgi:dipeptidyl aminopeptidase/acylaminoacyl peptidase
MGTYFSLNFNYWLLKAMWSFIPIQGGSFGYNQAFAAAIRGDWGNLDYADLMAATSTALSSERLDPDLTGVAGGSYGGYMTNWIVTQTQRFKAAVTMRSICDLYSFFGTSDGGFLHADDFGGPPWELPDKYMEQPLSATFLTLELPCY